MSNTEQLINHQDGLDIVTAIGLLGTHADMTSLITAVNTLAGNTAHIGDLSELTTDTQTSLVAAINEIGYNAIADGAGAHNAIYRGKYLGTSVTSAQYGKIADGSFHDLFIGDYWTIGGVNWRIAHFDYWWNYGDTQCATHHIVIVPDSNLLSTDGSTTHWMNTSNVTTGAYVGSGYYSGTNADSTSNTGRSQVTTKINNAFGSAHILSHREYLKNATSNGYESAGAWYDSTHEFMTEEMVYGGKEFKNAMCGTNVPANYTIGHGQLALFRLNRAFICNRANWWLRDVVSSTNFASVASNGICAYHTASTTWVGVRPDFGIKA